MTTTTISNVGNQAVRKKPTRKHLIIAAGAVAALLVAFYVANWWKVGRFMETTDDAYVGGDITVLAPKVSSLIAQVLVKDNQSVKAGDILVKLDDRDFKAALAKAEANVAGAEAAITNLDASSNLQQAVIEQSKAGITASKAETTRSHSDYTRYKALSQISAVSVKQFQQADADYQQSVANDHKASATLTASERQLDVIATQKQKAEAALAAAIAERDMAKLNLEYTEIRSPINGTIGNRSARVGSYATIGSQLVSVVPAEGLWVDANFKENQLAHMRPGQKAIIEADALSGQTLTGHVLSLAPATGSQFSLLPAENATGNFTKIVQRVPVRILLDGDASTFGMLRPGLSVKAEVDQRDAR